jgi:hypothetical protein
MSILRILGKLVLALIGLVLLLILGVVLLNLRDEALSPAAQSRLAAAKDPSGSDAGNSAYLIWAFDAPAGVDATQIGRAVLEAFAAISRERVAQNDWSIQRLYQPVVVEFPATLACIDPNSACIDQALAKPDVLNKWVAENGFLLGRLALIDTAPHWSVIPQLGAANAPLPPLRPLISTFSLSLDEAALEISEHHLQAGIVLLEQDVRIARRLLASSQSVVVKSVAADLLRRSMLAYSEILKGVRTDPVGVGLIAASLERVATDLTPGERGMQDVLAHEAESAADLADLVAHPGATLQGSFIERAATRAAPLFFKPAATINLEGELFDLEAAVLDADPASFAHQVESVRERFSDRAQAISHPALSSLYNPLGKVMAGYVPDLLDYAARIDDDQALLRAVRAQAWLMNQRVHFGQAQAILDRSPEDLWDPYLQRPWRWSAADAALIVTQHSSRGVPLVHVPLA